MGKILNRGILCFMPKTLLFGYLKCTRLNYVENNLRYIFCCFSVVDAVTSDIKSELPALNELIVAFAEAGSVKHAKKLVEVM